MKTTRDLAREAYIENRPEGALLVELYKAMGGAEDEPTRFRVNDAVRKLRAHIAQLEAKAAQHA